MIYFIVTTSLINTDFEKRKEQYINGITTLKSIVSNKIIKDYKIVIVENNGSRKTFLNDIHNEVFYTNNNFSSMLNKGNIELMDIKDVISNYNIQSDDFIVKLTGRYIIQNDRDFIIHINEDYDCIIRYGSYMNPCNDDYDDCVTGLIGMKCKYINSIQFAELNKPIERQWANATHNIKKSKIKKLDKLGLKMCPGSNTYFTHNI